MGKSVTPIGPHQVEFDNSRLAEAVEKMNEELARPWGPDEFVRSFNRIHDFGGNAGLMMRILRLYTDAGWFAMPKRDSPNSDPHGLIFERPSGGKGNEHA